VLFKVKVQRWRGALWVDSGVAWLVAAGQREEGSPDDFYASLAARGKARTGALQRRALAAGHEDELRYYAPNAESARAVGAVARVIAACRSAYSMWAQRGGRAKDSG